MKNCGWPNHADSCLCDVRYLGVTIDPDAVRGMWMGDRVAEVQGYNLTDRRDVLNWLSDVVMLHDEFTANHVPHIDEVMPIGDNPNPVEHWKEIRDGVAYVVRNYPITSVLVALDKLCVSFDQFIEAMTVRKLTREITLEQYVAFEADMLEPKPNYTQICKKHNLGRSTVGKFQKLLEPMSVRRNGDAGDLGLVKRELHNLIMSDATSEEIIEIMRQRYGMTYSKQAIYSHRSYHKNHAVK